MDAAIDVQLQLNKDDHVTKKRKRNGSLSLPELSFGLKLEKIGHVCCSIDSSQNMLIDFISISMVFISSNPSQANALFEKRSAN